MSPLASRLDYRAWRCTGWRVTGILRVSSQSGATVHTNAMAVRRLSSKSKIPRTARIGELLQLRWEHTTDGTLTFLETKNRKMRRVLIGPSIQAVLDSLSKQSPHVFTNSRTGEPFTVNGVRHVFDRAVVRAAITPSDDVTLHTLRHTALSRMIERRKLPLRTREYRTKFSRFFQGNWWTRRGSNSRPLHCERSALPAELRAPTL